MLEVGLFTSDLCVCSSGLSRYNCLKLFNSGFLCICNTKNSLNNWKIQFPKHLTGSTFLCPHHSTNYYQIGSQAWKILSKCFSCLKSVNYVKNITSLISVTGVLVVSKQTAMCARIFCVLLSFLAPAIIATCARILILELFFLNLFIGPKIKIGRKLFILILIEKIFASQIDRESIW